MRQVVFSARNREVRSRSMVAAAKPFSPARRLQHPLAVLVEVAAAVEDEPVVGANEIGVGERALVVGGAGGDQLAPGLHHSQPERRGGEVADQLGAGIGTAPGGTFRDSKGPRRLQGRSCRSRSGRRGRQKARRGHPRWLPARRGRRFALHRRRCTLGASLSGSASVWTRRRPSPRSCSADRRGARRRR